MYRIQAREWSCASATAVPTVFAFVIVASTPVITAPLLRARKIVTPRNLFVDARAATVILVVMDLATYLRKRGVPLADIQRATQISYPVLHRYKSGRRCKSAENARRIERATGGRVTVADMMGGKP